MHSRVVEGRLRRQDVQDDFDVVGVEQFVGGHPLQIGQFPSNDEGNVRRRPSDRQIGPNQEGRVLPGSGMCPSRQFIEIRHIELPHNSPIGHRARNLSSHHAKHPTQV